MSKSIRIIVGSMTGTAELVAEALAERLEELGRAARQKRMEKVKVENFDADCVWLICTSTYGTGEVPDNAKPLYEALKNTTGDYSHVRYGVVALGDSIYPKTFCNGGKNFDQVLTELGAQRIGELLEVDSRSPDFPEDRACDWVNDWIELV